MIPCYHRAEVIPANEISITILDARPIGVCKLLTGSNHTDGPIAFWYAGYMAGSQREICPVCHRSRERVCVHVQT